LDLGTYSTQRPTYNLLSTIHPKVQELTNTFNSGGRLQFAAMVAMQTQDMYVRQGADAFDGGQKKSCWRVVDGTRRFLVRGE
jgi:hypothetical protein